MHYLYHRVPENMSGHILYPLNVLKEKDIDLYTAHASKYKGREAIMEDRLPFLNCLWNDVLHMSAVHPRDIKRALIEAGQKGDFVLECFEIDPHLLNPRSTIVFLAQNDTRTEKLLESNFVSYNPDDIAQYATLSQVTKDYYRLKYEQGENPLLFHKIPHILYKGELDTRLFKKVVV